MREYETTFIIQPEIGEEGCRRLFDKVDETLEKAGARRLLHDDQGKRRLAYEIRKFQKGRFVTTYYLSGGEAVAPLERMLRIDETVLRFLTVQKDDAVEDIEARVAEAAEEARRHARRAQEKAAREAELEQSRRQAREQDADAAEDAAGEDAQDDEGLDAVGDEEADGVFDDEGMDADDVDADDVDDTDGADIAEDGEER